MPTRTIGCMATFPARGATLCQVLETVRNQLDILYVYLNAYEAIPDCLKGLDNVVPILGCATFGDIKANGKMFWLERERDGIVFTLDDDIHYPQDYVPSLLRTLAIFDGEACVAVHGSLFKADFAYYFERQAWFSMEDGFDGNNVINLVGSGTAAFPASMYADEDFALTGPMYVDLHISITALRKGLPLIAVARPAQWLHNLRQPGLWEETRDKITNHTALAFDNASLLSWEHLRTLWMDWLGKRRIPLEETGTKLNLSRSSMDFLAGRDLIIRNAEYSQLRKLIALADNLAQGGGT
ncbi:MAG: hypothetical protein IJS08_02840 [Victivallales bacterium]|nr:hypothetical protein [Victivallales bacterium]